MGITERLEIFRKIACLGVKDIQDIFDDEPVSTAAHLESKYEAAREDYGKYGNFHFLFQLDEDLANKVLTHCGFGDKPNSQRFIEEDR